MISTHADHNLLFGILALQMDFVGRDALIAAMHAWALDKNKPLGQILVAQGSLTPDYRALVDTVVEKHLAIHGNDVTRSLAAVPSPGAVEKELTRILDPELPTSNGASADGDRFATRGGTEDMPAASDLRFQILRPHARGGLGEVFVARDQELHREVALKQLQERHADNAQSRARFLLEAEITGALEHPGVVPVHGLGQYSDGRPFYAMRFIRGENLQKAIERFHAPAKDGRRPDLRGLEMRQLLGRFIAVCQVMAYAHSRCVIHRDLKPANIMLGQYGETLVVDWGLAKLTDQKENNESEERPVTPSYASGSAETLPGAAVGTPQYMSPEQAAGRVDQTGPCSDIYSLGATLYCLLSGRAPFVGSPDLSVGELLQKVQHGEFPPPRQVHADLPAALEAICLKAMALRPPDRYASVSDLAADLERWLADEPVAVYPEPWSTRLLRWMRRHRTGTLTAVAVLLTALLGTLAAAGLFAGLAEQERQARLAADRARAMAEQMREQRLQVAARFAARTVAGEMDLRWRILEAAAAEGELHRLLVELGEADQLHTQSGQQELQSWLELHHVDNTATTKALSWLVFDAHGRLLARSPADPKGIGRNFAYRDYFHGQGRDLPEGTAVDGPITDVHRSAVFLSKATGRRNIAFSVPVWDDASASRHSHVLGVLAMTVELGQFGVLKLGLGPDQLAVLVDTEADWLEGQPHAGLVLHHPKLAQAQRDNGPGSVAAESAFRVAPATVKLLVGRRDGFSGLDRNYVDPVTGPDAGLWLAAFEPVIVKGRRDEVQHTGWVVVVQERLNNAAPHKG